MDNNAENFKKIGKYVLIKKVGQGQFASVYRAALVDSPDQLFAVKAIKKSLIQKEERLMALLQTETRIMAKIKHPNILHLYDMFESESHYYLVVDYCDQGDLESHMKKNGRFNEDEAIYFLKQLMNGFKVLQKHKIMHRDLKLANIYLKKDTVVIGDFGFASQGADIARTRLGTPITMAPEILMDDHKSYTSKADLWSLGIVFYQLLFNRTPYNATSMEELRAKVKGFSEHKFDFQSDVKISYDSMDLIRALLQFDPIKRISWNDFFNHPIFKTHGNPKERLVNIKDSMIYRQNYELITHEFENNMSSGLEVIQEDAIEHENEVQMNKVVEERPRYQTILTIRQLEEKRVNLDIIRERLFHDQKVVSFIMLTAREFKNLANLKLDIPTYNSRFLLASYTLCRKGILILQFMVDSIKYEYNSPRLPHFEDFTKSEECQPIYDQMVSNLNIYTAFEQQVVRSINEEKMTDDFTEIREQIRHLVYHEIIDLEDYLKTHFNFFKDKVDLLIIPQTINKYFKLSLIHLYFCINSSEMFPFHLNGRTFDWNNFHFELTDTEIERAFSALKPI